jgi:hypothetical protein
VVLNSFAFYSISGMPELLPTSGKAGDSGDKKKKKKAEESDSDDDDASSSSSSSDDSVEVSDVSESDVHWVS